MRILAFALLCTLLPGCASHPEGVLRPAGMVPMGTDRVDMLVATTRAPAEAPKVDFTGERGRDMSLANIVVSIPPNRQVGTIQWPRSLPADPMRNFVTVTAEPLRRDEVFRWFRNAGQKARRVFVFVHGFNTRFDSAVYRFAQIAHDTDSGAAPVLFTWPSRGRILDYNYDRESANFSRSDLAYVLRAAVASPEVSEVTVLAHSMGCWIAVEALRDIALSGQGISPKINNVVLASPDLDVDVFLRQLEEIGPRRPAITVFTSERDRALGLSSFIAGRVTRVGGIGATDDEYRKRFAATPKLTFIDLSQMRGGDSLNHTTFATSPKVVQLIGNRLIAGQTITDSDAAGQGGPAQAFGSAAGALVAAPFLILQGAQTQ